MHEKLKNGAGKSFLFHAVIPALHNLWRTFYCLS